MPTIQVNIMINSGQGTFKFHVTMFGPYILNEYNNNFLTFQYQALEKLKKLKALKIEPRI